MGGRGPRGERVGTQTQKKGGGKKGGGPKGCWPRRVGGPNLEKVGGPKGGGPKISRFFSLSRRKISFFSSLSGGLLVEFWWCLKRRGAQMCTFGVLGLSCASPGGPVWWGRRGFTRQPENSKRAHLRVLVFKTPPKFNEKTPREGRKERNFAAGQGKKRAKFGRSRRRAVRRRAVRRRAVRRRAVPGEGGPAEGGPNQGAVRTRGVRWPKSVWPPKIGQGNAGGQKLVQIGSA